MTHKRQENTLIAAGICLLVCGGLNLLLRSSSRLPGLALVHPFVALSFLVTLTVYIRVRLLRLTHQEERERKLLEQERPESALFTSGDGELDPFSIARSREQFERFVVPALAPLLAVIELFFAWRLYRGNGLPAATASHELLAAAFLAGEAFVMFLLSRYALALGRLDESRLLRGPGIYLGLACFAMLLALAGALASHFQTPHVERATAWVAGLFLCFLAAENVLAVLADLYRPRRAGLRCVTAYESRVGALLTDPATWVRNIAQAIDYQFGFDVSHTWLYRFFAHALAPLITFQLAVLYLLSCLVFLQPHEEGILERFGKPLDPAGGRGHLQPGLHLKWPWPFETVRRFPAKRIITRHIGFAGAHDHDPEYVIWTVPHHDQQEMFITASRDTRSEPAGEEASVPVNFLSAHIPVQYRVTNLYQFAYNHADPGLVLDQIAYRGVTREAVARGLFDMVGEGQLDIARELSARIQAAADELQLGIRIEFVALQGVHPPVAVAESFESVIAAIEEKEAAILEARAYASRALPLAEAEAVRTRLESEAYRTRRIELASAEADRFEKRRIGYGKTPSVFKTDTYLRTLQDALRHTRKYIVGAVPASEVLQFDFEEKINPDLFDFGPAGKGIEQ